jgi:sirohydrochlorin cobaltochelatase
MGFIMIFMENLYLFRGQSERKTPQTSKSFNQKIFKEVNLQAAGDCASLECVNREGFFEDILVVLGHGTVLNDNSAAPVFQHAAELRRRKIFGEVREAFWKQEPQIRKMLVEISAPRVFIVPLFISEGYFSTEIIPQELGFQFPDNIKLKIGDSAWFYCRPVGSHDSMTRVILSRAEEVIKKFPFPRAPKLADVTLFIAGHGTEKNENSRKAIERQAELIRAQKIYAGVHAVFLEESPRIADCYSLARTKNVVVVPFFISDGLHVVEDIPILLGEPARIIQERLKLGQPVWRNPTEKNGKLVWYSPAVGSDPGMADVILERVCEAAK